MRVAALFLLTCIAAAPAAAQSIDAESFGGGTLAISGGLVQHHFTPTENGDDREVEGWGAGGAVTFGYMAPIGSRVLVGVEGSYHFGGVAAETLIANGQGARFGIDPRYGFSGVARLGYVVAPDVMVFGAAGYGEHRYREILPTGPVSITSDLTRNSSFVLGAGAEYRLSRRLSIRADARHLDGTRNEALVGLQVRF